MIGFGKRLEQAIAEAGMYQYQLANEIGVSRWVVSKWVQGHQCPSCYNLYLICLVTGVSADWLLGLKEEKI